MSKALLCLSLSFIVLQTFYYQGKTITIITGSQAGDLFDIYARMIATHMGKNIPGNPNMVVQNMTGSRSYRFREFRLYGRQTRRPDFARSQP